jgi:hemerythrin
VCECECEKWQNMINYQSEFERFPSDHETFLKRIKSVGIKRFKTVRKLLKITKILNEYLFVYPKSTRASTRENTVLK